MKISIIIATYNRHDLLKNCLNSILKQTFTDFEVIVVDDGSTDNTEDFFKKEYVDERIRYFKFEENRGQSAARNKGIDESRGELLIIWDSDDELYPDALKELIDVYNHKNEPDLIYAPADFYKNDKKKNIKEVSSGFISYEERLSDILPENDVVILFKKERIGNVRFCGANVDSIFYHLLAPNSTTYHLNKSLGKIYLISDKNSLTLKRKIPNIKLSIKRALCIDGMLQKMGGDLLKVNKIKYSHNAYGASVGLLLGGQKMKAIRYAWLAAKYNPKKNYILFFLFSLLPFSSPLLRISFQIKKFLFFRNT